MPPDITTALKLLSDTTRLRIISALSGNELTVKELTEALQIGQSTLSTQLGQLKDGNLVSSRKEGQFVYYRMSRFEGEHSVSHIVRHVLAELAGSEWHDRDRRKLREILSRRREASLSYFSSIKTQNQVSPGQTWESLALGFAHLVKDKDIVDLGCGIGRLSILFADGGNRVTGIDASADQIASARDLHQARLGENLRFIQAPMESTGLPGAGFDLAIISQALHHAAEPTQAIAEAGRLLRSGGQALILDLVRHSQDWMRDKFADFWLGFDPDDIRAWLIEAGFDKVQELISGPDTDYPQIETLIMLAAKR